MTLTQTVLSALVRRFELSLAPGTEVVGTSSPSTRPPASLDLRGDLGGQAVVMTHYRK